MFSISYVIWECPTNGLMVLLATPYVTEYCWKLCAKKVSILWIWVCHKILGSLHLLGIGFCMCCPKCSMCLNSPKYVDEFVLCFVLVGVVLSCLPSTTIATTLSTVSMTLDLSCFSSFNALASSLEILSFRGQSHLVTTCLWCCLGQWDWKVGCCSCGSAGTGWCLVWVVTVNCMHTGWNCHLYHFCSWAATCGFAPQSVELDFLGSMILLCPASLTLFMKVWHSVKGNFIQNPS